jgi:hypothetical protein
MIWCRDFLSACCIRWQSDNTYVIPLLLFVSEADGSHGTLQVTNCEGMSNIGSPLPTHQRIMTSFGKRTTQELPHGSLIVMH